MTCACGNSYIVRSGDTLYIIAERELGDGERWQEITKSNCTPFTEEEARMLQPDNEVCLPDGNGGDSSGFEEIVSRQIYETMFPNRNSLYSYDSLVTATQRYPNFCDRGTDTQRKREATAFLANIGHETADGNSGLVYIEELRCIPTAIGDEYCESARCGGSPHCSD